MIVKKKTMRSLLSIIFLDQICFTIAFPLLTLIFFDEQSHLFSPDTSAATRSLWYGMCISLPYTINIFFTPTLSALSDALGRKKILVIEVASAILFSLCVGLGIYLGMLSLVFFAFMIRGAFSRTNPTALAIIGDTAPKDKKIIYMGYLQFAISVGATLGPLLGGYFANKYFFSTLNFSFPFIIAACIAIINTFVVMYFMRETLVIREKKKWSSVNLSALKYIITHPDVLRISLILFLIQLSWSTYYQFIPPILKTIYGFDSHQLGTFIGMIAFWLSIATGIGVNVLHRFMNARKMLLVSVYLVFFGLMITVLACAKILPFDTFLIWLGALPTAAGDVIAYSCLTALYSNVVAADEQGKVMGVGFLVVSTVWASTGFIGGILMSISPILPLVVAPLGIVAAILLIRTEFGHKLVTAADSSAA